MTENELRQAVVAQATAWYGCNEADGSPLVIRWVANGRWK